MSVDLQELLRYARQRYIPVMLDDTRQLLFDVVSRCRPKRILEIGTAIGYSGIIMLTASPLATLNTIELDEQVANIARQNFQKAEMSDRVNLFVGDAREIVTLLTGSYDFIFMDGPKGQYEVFLPYLTEVLEVGGTLVCDNVLYKGLAENVPENKRHKHITVARNMHAFLQDITTNQRYRTQLYRTGDGVSVSVKLK
ncbi:o-methyltransferase [Corallococcus sp. CAG:1435]|uniref:O-methyltransferase n=1 Tax=Candidatus Fimimonas gallinarum TaxID=2840821 RepID=A0A9D1E3C7_9BACT|nr:o-methyltransferase [Corallococcus sp. CAG:1435]HIR65475.1 O-methyltransferase [Candidatus Fimimonas gallinarum]